MDTLQLEQKAIRKIKSKKRFLEKKLKIKLEIKNKTIIISGQELDEYEAELVLQAIDAGFDIETSLLLLNEDYSFELVNIKDLTKRKDLSQIRARIIGTKGKTLKTLKALTNCEIILKDNQIYIIGQTENTKDALNGLKKLIQGAKQSSTYSYLEKQRKNTLPPDLGLKN